LRHKAQGEASVRSKHASQSTISFFIRTIASDSSWTWASGAESRWKASREADFSPIPGSRFRAATTRSIGGEERTPLSRAGGRG